VNRASLFREEFEVPPADRRDRPGAIVELPLARPDEVRFPASLSRLTL
jgi:hypothetical protein